jgi:hypothetical protein
MNISDFIQEVLIDQFREIQQNEENPYISFGLICQGIEFWGTCLDSESISAKGLLKKDKCQAIVIKHFFFTSLDRVFSITSLKSSFLKSYFSTLILNFFVCFN